MNLKKNIATILLLCTVTLGLVMSGCSSGGSSGSATAPNQSTVYGVAALGTAIPSGTVSAKDSSVPAQEKTAAISNNGSFTVDVSGLNPPYVLKAVSTDSSGTTIQMYSVSMTGGKTNINEITDVAVVAAANGINPENLYAMPTRDTYQRTSDDFGSIISRLQTVLAPLFALYNVSGSPVTDDDHEYGEYNNSGLSALLHDVQFIVNDGKVLVKNRATGAIIFSGSLNNLNAGTFYPANMPAGPGGSTGSTTCTSFTYSGWGTCQSNGTQTQTVVTSSPAGCTGGTPVLSQSCTYVPPVCTYNYSAWGACQSNGTQTRTAISSPAGCIGTPGALSQSCTYVPPVTACTSFTYSAWGACQSNNTQTRTIATSSPAGCTGGSPILSQACTYVPPACSYTYDAWGTCQSNGTQTRNVLTTSPTGCTGTPATSQACTYVPPVCTSFTYSAWGTCQSNGTQTRTLATSSPAGCTGGAPVLSQSCTYVPPACTSFTYSAWSACQSNNTQTRTVATSSPAGCTGGAPALSQSCVYVPPVTTITMANVTTSCTGCHGLTVNGNVFATGGYTVTGRTAANWLTSINNMIGHGASLTPAGATAQDYANFLAALPTPAPVACTSFTYSAWGTCQSNGTQTRTVATSTPAGCTGGSPVLSQSCTYVPPVTACTSFTYSAWGTCQSNNTQTRTIATSSPAGCTGGSPLLSQACTYTAPNPVTMAVVQSTCTQCHGLTVNTTVFKSGGYSVSGRTASQWVSALSGMMTPPAGTTYQNFADFLVTVP